MTPTALGPMPMVGSYQGSQVQAAPGSPVAVHAYRRQQAEPGVIESARDGAQVDRAAEEGAQGRVAEGDAAKNAQPKAAGQELLPEEMREVEQLQQTDREVRQHELAHQITGGPYTGSATFDYEVGPDGQRYAVAGRVSVDYGAVTGDPKATVEKMKTVIAAALAPADPSPQDHQVAARARQTLLSAQLEVSAQMSQQLDQQAANTESPSSAPDARPESAMSATSAGADQVASDEAAPDLSGRSRAAEYSRIGIQTSDERGATSTATAVATGMLRAVA